MTTTTPTIQRILPGNRYSEAVIAGGFIYCAGLVPDNTDDDIVAQTKDVLAQLDALLAQCGTDKMAVVDTVIYLADMADYAGMNIAWDSWIAPGQAPARATVEARLANPAWRIEIKVTAFKGE
ncbi:MAG: RidA family protein [Rheinheimera sp.]|nr:RidA family protein [Rheinheimera sp.]